VRIFSLSRLLDRFPERTVWAGFLFVNGFIAIAIAAAAAMVLRTPLVFPSLGPTAFLFFFTPTVPDASPRHAIFGHAIGILCGYGSLLLVGLQYAPSAMAAGIGPRRGLAAALSLAATGALMVLARTEHPPATATTLIISLGIVTAPLDLLILEAAVVLLTVQAIVVNRMAGLDYPYWSQRVRTDQVGPPESHRFRRPG
jgi:CBS-domain-containing membrane protein